MKPLIHWGKPHFRPLCVLPLAAVALCFGYFIGVICLAGKVSFAESKTVLSLVFMALAFFLNLVFFLDILFREKVSHIAFILLDAVLVSAYCLAFLIRDFASGATSAGVFMTLAFLASIGAIVFYELKALDGDADWRYWLFAILTWAFLLFASIGNYSLFDAYAHVGDAPFWGGYVAGRTMIYCSILTTFVSLASDYDPNPIMLDDFGNPIDNEAHK